jgi:hypothetical protein
MAGERDVVSSERRKTSMEWPTVVDDRLRLLVGLAERSGDVTGGTSAAELVAALICTQPIDAATLGKTVCRYRDIGPEEIAAETRRHGPLPPTMPRRGRPRGARPARSTTGTANRDTHAPD